MSSKAIVIAGAGLAGATAAQTLRAEGHTGPLTLIGAETHAPYLRPPLSKAFLAGTEDRESLAVAPPGRYAELGVDLLTGTTVAEIRVADRQVLLGSGRTLPYDDLLLATGAAPRHLTVPGGALPGLRCLRTVDDSVALKADLAALGERGRLVVLGAGWLGMEVAASARTLGTEVTVVGREPVPLSAVLGDRLGAHFLRRHEQAGVRFRLGHDVNRILATDGRASSVLLDTHEQLPADLILVAVGAVPNTALAAAAGLEVADGIRTDQRLRTSAPHVFAAGDVAAVYDPRLGRHQRNEHWANAIASGEAAARSMLGVDGGLLDAIPYFYTDQFDIGMEYSGYPSLARDAELVFRGEPDSGEFLAFWVRPVDDTTGVVVAGMNVNVWDVQDEIRGLISSGEPVDLRMLTGSGAVAR